MNEAKQSRGLSAYPEAATMLDSDVCITQVKPTGNDRYAKFPWQFSSGRVGFRGRDPLSCGIRASIHLLERGRIPPQVRPAKLFPSSTGPCCAALHEMIEDYAEACVAVKNWRNELKNHKLSSHVPVGKGIYAIAMQAEPDFLVHARMHKDIVEVSWMLVSS